MKLMMLIGIIVGVTTLITLASLLHGRWQQHRNLIKFENYDRELNPAELKYLEQAQLALEKAQADTNLYPKWYGFFLSLGFFPTLLVCMGLCTGGVFGLNILLTILWPPPNNALILQADMLAGFGTAIFAGIFMAGWALYGVTVKSSTLSNYVALKSDIYGFNEDAIHQRQLGIILHHVRARLIAPEQPFDATDFLKSRNISYREGCKKWTMSTLALSLVLAVFDANYYRALRADHIQSSGPYFSVLQPLNIPLQDIDTVEIRCFSNKNNDDGQYRLLKDRELIADFDINAETIQPLSRLDQVLREQEIQFKRHAHRKNGAIKRNFYHARCVTHFLDDFQNQFEDLQIIFHVDEFLQ